LHIINALSGIIHSTRERALNSSLTYKNRFQFVCIWTQ